MEDVETCASTAGGQAVNWSSAREEINESNLAMSKSSMR